MPPALPSLANLSLVEPRATYYRPDPLTPREWIELLEEKSAYGSFSIYKNDAEELMRNAPEDIKRNEEVMTIAIMNNPEAIKHASVELRNDFDTVAIAVTSRWQTLKYASNRLKADKSIVFYSLETFDRDVSNLGDSYFAGSETPFTQASDTLKKNFDLLLDILETYKHLNGFVYRIFEEYEELKTMQNVLKCIAKDYTFFGLVEEEWKANAEYMKDVIETGVDVIRLLDRSTQMKNITAVRNAVSRSGLGLKFVAEDLRNIASTFYDERLVMGAIENTAEAVLHVLPKLDEEQSTILDESDTAVFDWDRFRIERKKALRNSDFMIKAVQRDRNVLEYAWSNSLYALNRNVGFCQMLLDSIPDTNSDGTRLNKEDEYDFVVYKFRSYEARDNIVFMETLLEQNPNYLAVSSDRLKNLPSFLADTVLQKSPLNIQYAGDVAKDNGVLMKDVVTRDGLALKFASFRLRWDKDVVMAAAEQNAFALQFVAPRPNEVFKFNHFEPILGEGEETYMNEWALRYKDKQAKLNLEDYMVDEGDGDGDREVESESEGEVEGEDPQERAERKRIKQGQIEALQERERYKMTTEDLYKTYEYNLDDFITTLRVSAVVETFPVLNESPIPTSKPTEEDKMFAMADVYMDKLSDVLDSWVYATLMQAYERQVDGSDSGLIPRPRKDQFSRDNIFLMDVRNEEDGKFYIDVLLQAHGNNELKKETLEEIAKYLNSVDLQELSNDMNIKTISLDNPLQPKKADTLDRQIITALKEDLQMDDEINTLALEKDPYSIGYIDDKWHTKNQRNKDLVVAAIDRQPLALEWASKKIRKDAKIVIMASDKNIEAFKFGLNTILKSNIDQWQALIYRALIEDTENTLQVLGRLEESAVAPKTDKKNSATEQDYRFLRTALEVNPDAIGILKSDQQSVVYANDNIIIPLLQDDGMLLRHFAMLKDQESGYKANSNHFGKMVSLGGDKYFICNERVRNLCMTAANSNGLCMKYFELLYPAADAKKAYNVEGPRSTVIKEHNEFVDDFQIAALKNNISAVRFLSSEYGIGNGSDIGKSKLAKLIADDPSGLKHLLFYGQSPYERRDIFSDQGNEEYNTDKIFKANSRFLADVLTLNTSAVNYMSASMMEYAESEIDVDSAKRLVNTNGLYLKTMPKFSNNEDVVRLAVLDNGDALDFAASRLNQNSGFRMLAAKTSVKYTLNVLENIQSDLVYQNTLMFDERVRKFAGLFKDPPLDYAENMSRDSMLLVYRQGARRLYDKGKELASENGQQLGELKKLWESIKELTSNSDSEKRYYARRKREDELAENLKKPRISAESSGASVLGAWVHCC